MPNQNIPKKILHWYDNNKRTLPWRKKVSKSKREYFTLISEFMLQQTQVKTVIPYFENFVKNFPNLQSLAKSSCLLYTSPSPRDRQKSRMPSSA